LQGVPIKDDAKAFRDPNETSIPIFSAAVFFFSHRNWVSTADQRMKPNFMALRRRRPALPFWGISLSS